MELSYWQSRWKKGKTGFHMEEGYPGLIRYWNSIRLDADPAVLVPLCGKTKDMIFLSQHCRQVIGVEISEMAVQEFLTDNNFKAEKTTFAGFTVYQTGNIQLWQGDFFKLPKHKLPRIDLIYDKAALIALPPDLREQYIFKIKELVSQSTQILLHLFEYRQKEMSGPPFSVPVDEAERRFGDMFTIKILEKKELGPDYYKKFQSRGLHSYFIEILSLLLPKEA